MRWKSSKNSSKCLKIWMSIIINMFYYYLNVPRQQRLGGKSFESLSAGLIFTVLKWVGLLLQLKRLSASEPQLISLFLKVLVCWHRGSISQCSHGNMKIDYRCIKRCQRDIKEGRGTWVRVGQRQNCSKGCSTFGWQGSRKERGVGWNERYITSDWIRGKKGNIRWGIESSFMSYSFFE